MSNHKFQKKNKNLGMILAKFIVLCVILMLTFIVLSLSLRILPAFYFHILFFVTLDFMLAAIPIFWIIEILIKHQKPNFKEVKPFIFFVIIIGGFIFTSFTFYLKNRIEDIPYAIHSKYSYVEGTCYDTNIGGKNAFYFKIDGIQFYVGRGASKYIVSGRKYKIVYLPNSKTVIKAILLTD